MNTAETNDETGQIIATSHDLTRNDGLVREIPLFQGNLGWWNIIIWLDETLDENHRSIVVFKKDGALTCEGIQWRGGRPVDEGFYHTARVKKNTLTKYKGWRFVWKLMIRV